MKKQVIFGLGTGRCGTGSLTAVLNLQTGVKVSHELDAKMLLPWEVNEAKFNSYCNNIERRAHPIVGDVAFWLLPYVPLIRRRFPDCKFVILHRDKNETVMSYEKKTIGRNHWNAHDGSNWALNMWDICFPKYDSSSKSECIAQYYDEYYQTCRKILPDALWLCVDDLNDETITTEMLTFCGISDPVYSKIQTNTSG